MASATAFAKPLASTPSGLGSRLTSLSRRIPIQRHSSCRPSFCRRLQVSASAVRQLERVSRDSVLRPFNEKRAVKIISGLRNFNRENVADVVAAAEQGGATHVDIACDPDLVRLAKEITRLPVCVSSVQPSEFVAAVAAGADMVEIGNYDSFYSEGRKFGAEEVLNLTRQTRARLPDTPLSVTVPHTLPLHEQMMLADQLAVAGADIIQTEGGVVSRPTTGGVQGLIEKAAPTLAAAYAISHAVTIPVMCASGISDVTAPLAIASGASGVGVGSAVNKLNNRLGMVAAVRAIVANMEKVAPISKRSILAAIQN